MNEISALSTKTTNIEIGINLSVGRNLDFLLIRIVVLL
jgi:hypothetical protein